VADVNDVHALRFVVDPVKQAVGTAAGAEQAGQLDVARHAADSVVALGNAELCPDLVLAVGTPGRDVGFGLGDGVADA